jgi:hypothetical protein
MKRLKTLLLAASPLAIGYAMNHAMLSFNWGGLMYSLVSILFAVYWYWAGYASYVDGKTALQSILLGNSVGLLSLLLVLLQAATAGKYPPLSVGVMAQLFFLPGLRVGFWVESILLAFAHTRYLWITFIITFISMVAIFGAGCLRRGRRR